MTKATRKDWRPWLSVTLGVLLFGCATVENDGHEVAIASELRMVLPEPSALGRRIDAIQIVIARRDGDVFAFEGRLSVTPERLLLVGTDTLGRRAMTITWTDKGLVADKAIGLPQAVRPENVLADIVLMFWPETVVREALRASGATLATDTRSRTVQSRGANVISITYDGQQGDPWSGITRLRNTSWGYELEIRSAVISP